MSAATLDLTATKLDLVVHTGDDIDVEVPIRQEGAPLDVSAWSFACDIVDDTEAVIVACAIDTTDAAAGVVRIQATATQLAAIATGTDYRWSFVVTDGSFRRTYFAGTVWKEDQ